MTRQVLVIVQPRPSTYWSTHLRRIPSPLEYYNSPTIACDSEPIMIAKPDGRSAPALLTEAVHTHTVVLLHQQPRMPE